MQVHRLREVLSLVGFTRFEAVMPERSTATGRSMVGPPWRDASCC